MEPHRETISDPTQLTSVGKAMGPMQLRQREIARESLRPDPNDCEPFTVISLIQSVTRPERVPFFPYAFTNVSHQGIELVCVIHSTDPESAARVVPLHFPGAQVLRASAGSHNVEGIEWYGTMPSLKRKRRGLLARLFGMGEGR